MHSPAVRHPSAATAPQPLARPLARAAAAYALAGGVAAGAIAGPVLALLVDEHLVSALRAWQVTGGAMLATGLLSAWVAVLSRAGLREGARSPWSPALLLSVWGLAVAGGTLAAPWGFGAGAAGTAAGIVVAVSGFTVGWAWLERKRGMSEERAHL